MNFIQRLFAKQTTPPEIVPENNDTKIIELNSQTAPSMSTLTDNLNNEESSNGQSPEISEKLFVEYEKPLLKDQSPEQTEVEVWDIISLYKHLNRNLEKDGYDDALTNPDTSYMNERIEYLRNDISLLISRIKNYYRSYLNKIDFHIESRKRNGMIETVEELLNFKNTIEGEMDTVAAIEEDTKAGVGLSQNLILSYKRGFKNGFAAITYNTILNRKL